MAKYRFEEAKNVEVFEYPFSREDLLDLRRQLAKAANQRMVRLENTTSKVTGENYTFGAYDVAKEYLEKQGRNRFAETRKQDSKSDFQLKREIAEIQNFLQSKSSTIKGMHQIEKRRAESFKNKGLSKDVPNLKEFYDFLNSRSYEKLNEAWNSNDIIDVYDRAYKDGLTPEQIQKQFDEYMTTNKPKTKKDLLRFMKAKPIKRSSNRRRKKR